MGRFPKEIRCQLFADRETSAAETSSNQPADLVAHRLENDRPDGVTRRFSGLDSLPVGRRDQHQRASRNPSSHYHVSLTAIFRRRPEPYLISDAPILPFQM